MEVHGFTDSGCIDVTIEGVRMTVPDDPANRHRQTIAEWESEGNSIPPYVPPNPTDQPYRKSVFIRRMTDAEAETTEGVLANVPAKLRLMFNSAEYFVSDDPLFTDLQTSVGAALGTGRAAELLAVEAA